MVFSSLNVAMSLSIAGNKGNGGRVSYIFAIYISMCVSSNPVEGRTKIGHPKDLILTLFDLIFRRIYMFSINLVFEVTLKSSGTDIVYGCQLLRCLYNYRLLYGIFHIACHINPRRPY